MHALSRDGPLDGLRVIDCSGMISGGFATAQLADFGADVVMVEHPEHPDPLREWPPFDRVENTDANDATTETTDASDDPGGDPRADEEPTDAGETVSLWWKSIGRNKRCVTLDLSAEEGSALLLELIDDADVLFENFRPGTMEGWGLGPDTLSATNPRLITVRLSGYGQTGPRSGKPGFGTVAEGLSGWAHANGFADREPLLPPISLADLMTAQFAVQATMFAIFERDLGRRGGEADEDESGGSGSGTHGSGEGQVVDVSLYEPLFRLFVGDVEAYDRLGHVRERTGNRHPNAAPRNVYETSDSYLTLSASSQRIFENVMDAISRPDLVSDPRFATNENRVENAAALDSVIEAWTRERTTEKAISEMEAADAIVGPVYDMSDVFADAQYAARKDIVRVADDQLGDLATAAPIPFFSRTPGSVSHMGPRHGEHTDEVLRDEIGLDAAEVARLRDAGVC